MNILRIFVHYKEHYEGTVGYPGTQTFPDPGGAR